jgi:hypothetical protein
METLPECGAESVKLKAAPFRGWAGRKNIALADKQRINPAEVICQGLYLRQTAN